MKTQMKPQNFLGAALTFVTSLMIGAVISLALTTPSSAQTNSTDTQMKRGFVLATGYDTATVNDRVHDIYGMGGRIVRYPIYLDSLDPSTGRPWSLDSWIGWINSLLDYCDRYCPNMTVIVDLHNPGPPGTPKMPSHNIDLVHVWQQLAGAFKGRSASRVDYEMLNEPLPMYNNDAWANVALRIAQEIRVLDKVHPIIYAVPGSTTGPITSQNSTFVPLPNITNQIIEVHFWNWAGTPARPDVQTVARTVLRGTIPQYGSPGRDRAALSAIFRMLDTRRSAYKMPIIISEVGIDASQPDAAAFLKDFTDLSVQYGITTTVHAYEEDPAWNYEANRPAWNVLLHWLNPSATYEVNPAAKYEIVSAWDGKCIDINLGDGTMMQQWDFLGGVNQEFQFQPMGNGYYEIVSIWSGKCIDVNYSAGPVNGAPVRSISFLAPSSLSSGINQKWRLQPMGDGTYEIISKWDGRCLDVDNSGGPVNGARLQQWDILGGVNQKWVLVPR